MKIGILQTGYVTEPLVEQFGEYPKMFEHLLASFNFEFETFLVANNHFPKSINECDGWIITGSAFGAYEPHSFIPPLEEFIRSAYEQEVPMAGVCFGHQIMAQALGGRVEKFKGGWGVGQDSFETENGSISLLALHQDQVVEKPADAKVICSTDFCKNAGLAYKKQALSFQPHPEFSPEFMKALIEVKSGDGIPVPQATKAFDGVQEENDSQKIANQIGEFFLEAQRQA